MLKDFFHKLYDFLKRVLSSRIFALALVFTGMFLILAVKLFDLQIVNGESYLEDYVQMIEKTVTTISMTATGIFWPTMSWLTQ